MAYNYGSEYAKKHALSVLNKGEAACSMMLKHIEEIKFELNKTRLDFVYVRTALYGKGKGKTGKSRKSK